MINARWTNLWRLVLGLWFLFAVYLVTSAVVARQTTGLLTITSVDKNAALVVSQSNTDAVRVGVGSAKVRLKPGTYQVSASDSGKQANGTVTVSKQHTTNSHLNPTKRVQLPTIEAINFQGMGRLTSDGISTQQISNLEQEFFQFKPSAQTVIVNTDSVEPGPHNPNVDTSFTINFSVAIDSSTYKATISYNDIMTVRLYLYDSKTGSQVFDSASDNLSAGE